MNISITNYCNRNCSFCFQEGWYRTNKNNASYMNLDMIEKILNWYTGNHLSLMGGEPLVHPQILEIVDLCQNYKKGLTILTNLSNKKIAKNLLDKGVKKWLVNASSMNWNKNIEDAFSLFKNKDLSVAFTLEPKEKNVDIVNKIIKISNITENENLSVRISPMTPSIHEYNENYNYTNDIIFIMSSVLEKVNANFSFDCKINLCEIDQELIENLKKFPVNFTHRDNECEISPPFDILVDGSAVYCSSANFLKIDNIFDYENSEAAVKEFRRQAKEYWLNNSVNNKCKNCNSYTFACKGMCIAKNNAILRKK